MRKKRWKQWMAGFLALAMLVTETPIVQAEEGIVSETQEVVETVTEEVVESVADESEQIGTTSSEDEAGIMGLQDETVVTVATFVGEYNQFYYLNLEEDYEPTGLTYELTFADGSVRTVTYGTPEWNELESDVYYKDEWGERVTADLTTGDFYRHFNLGGYGCDVFFYARKRYEIQGVLGTIYEAEDDATTCITYDIPAGYYRIARNDDCIIELTNAGGVVAVADAEWHYLSNGRYVLSIDNPTSVKNSTGLISAKSAAEGYFYADFGEYPYIEYFEFIPATSGTYHIYSLGDHDTYGRFDDANGNEDVNDDGGAASNFFFEKELEAGQPYYIGTHFFSPTAGSIKVVIEKVRSFIACEVVENPTATMEAGQGYYNPEGLKVLLTDENGETITLTYGTETWNANESDVWYSDEENNEKYLDNPAWSGTAIRHSTIYGQPIAVPFTITPVAEAAIGEKYSIEQYVSTRRRIHLEEQAKVQVVFENAEEVTAYCYDENGAGYGNLIDSCLLQAGDYYFVMYYYSKPVAEEETTFYFVASVPQNIEFDGVVGESYTIQPNSIARINYVLPTTGFRRVSYDGDRYKVNLLISEGCGWQPVPDEWMMVFPGSYYLTVDTTEETRERTICFEAPDYQAIEEGAHTVYSDGYAFLKFTPKEDGYYNFYSETEFDTRGYIFEHDEEGAWISDDDNGSSLNFRLTYMLWAGKEYYLVASYSDNRSADMDIVVERATGIVQISYLDKPYNGIFNFASDEEYEPVGLTMLVLYGDGSDRELVYGTPEWEAVESDVYYTDTEDNIVALADIGPGTYFRHFKIGEHPTSIQFTASALYETEGSVGTDYTIAEGTASTIRYDIPTGLYCIRSSEDNVFNIKDAEGQEVGYRTNSSFFLMAGSYELKVDRANCESVSVALVEGQAQSVEEGTFDAVIDESNLVKYFSFVPAHSGTYYIYSMSSEDTLGYFANTDDGQDQNDDDGENSNFRFEKILEAGKTYYIGVRYYSIGTIGTIPVKIERQREFVSYEIISEPTVTSIEAGSAFSPDGLVIDLIDDAGARETLTYGTEQWAAAENWIYYTDESNNGITIEEFGWSGNAIRRSELFGVPVQVPFTVTPVAEGVADQEYVLESGKTFTFHYPFAEMSRMEYEITNTEEYEVSYYDGRSDQLLGTVTSGKVIPGSDYIYFRVTVNSKVNEEEDVIFTFRRVEPVKVEIDGTVGESYTLQPNAITTIHYQMDSNEFYKPMYAGSACNMFVNGDGRAFSLDNQCWSIFYCGKNDLVISTLWDTEEQTFSLVEAEYQSVGEGRHTVYADNYAFLKFVPEVTGYYNCYADSEEYVNKYCLYYGGCYSSTFSSRYDSPLWLDAGEEYRLVTYFTDQSIADNMDVVIERETGVVFADLLYTYNHYYLLNSEDVYRPFGLAVDLTYGDGTKKRVVYGTPEWDEIESDVYYTNNYGESVDVSDIEDEGVYYRYFSLFDRNYSIDFSAVNANEIQGTLGNTYTADGNSLTFITYELTPGYYVEESDPPRSDPLVAVFGEAVEKKESLWKIDTAGTYVLQVQNYYEEEPAVVALTKAPFAVLGSQDVVIKENKIAYLPFVPEKDGTYRIYSENYYGIVGYFNDGIYTFNYYGDFDVERRLTAGTTYLIGVRYYDWSAGIINLTIEKEPSVVDYRLPSEDFAEIVGVYATGNYHYPACDLTLVYEDGTEKTVGYYDDGWCNREDDAEVRFLDGDGNEISFTAGIPTGTYYRVSMISDCEVRIPIKVVESDEITTGQTWVTISGTEGHSYVYTVPKDGTYYLMFGGEAGAKIMMRFRDTYYTKDLVGEGDGFSGICEELSAGDIVTIDINPNGQVDTMEVGIDIYKEAAPESISMVSPAKEWQVLYGSEGGPRFPGLVVNVEFDNGTSEEITFGTDAWYNNLYFVYTLDEYSKDWTSDLQGVTLALGYHEMLVSYIDYGDIELVIPFSVVTFEQMDGIYPGEEVAVAPDNYGDIYKLVIEESGWYQLTVDQNSGMFCHDLYDENGTYLEPIGNKMYWLEAGNYKFMVADDQYDQFVVWKAAEIRTVDGIVGAEYAVENDSLLVIRYELEPGVYLQKFADGRQDVLQSASGETVEKAGNIWQIETAGTYTLQINNRGNSAGSAGLDVVTAVAALGGQAVDVLANSVTYLTFVPEESGKYNIYSLNESDTYGYFVDRDEFAEDDDSGSSLNFFFSKDLTAGEVYVIGVKFLGGQAGTIDLNIEKEVPPVGYRLISEDYAAVIGRYSIGRSSSERLNLVLLYEDGTEKLVCDTDPEWKETDVRYLNADGEEVALERGMAAGIYERISSVCDIEVRIPVKVIEPVELMGGDTWVTVSGKEGGSFIFTAPKAGNYTVMFAGTDGTEVMSYSDNSAASYEMYGVDYGFYGYSTSYPAGEILIFDIKPNYQVETIDFGFSIEREIEVESMSVISQDQQWKVLYGSEPMFPGLTVRVYYDNDTFADYSYGTDAWMCNISYGYNLESSWEEWTEDGEYIYHPGDYDEFGYILPGEYEMTLYCGNASVNVPFKVVTFDELDAVYPGDELAVSPDFNTNSYKLVVEEAGWYQLSATQDYYNLWYNIIRRADNESLPGFVGRCLWLEAGEYEFQVSDYAEGQIVTWVTLEELTVDVPMEVPGCYDEYFGYLFTPEKDDIYQFATSGDWSPIVSVYENYAELGCLNLTYDGQNCMVTYDLQKDVTYFVAVCSRYASYDSLHQITVSEAPKYEVGEEIPIEYYRSRAFTLHVAKTGYYRFTTMNNEPFELCFSSYVPNFMNSTTYFMEKGDYRVSASCRGTMVEGVTPYLYVEAFEEIGLEENTVNVSTGETKEYTFVPEVSGTYYFYTTSAVYAYTYGCLAGKGFSTYNYGGNGNGGFRITYDLEAGKSYAIGYQLQSYYPQGVEITLHVEKKKEVDAFEILQVPTDTIIYYPFATSYVDLTGLQVKKYYDDGSEVICNYQDNNWYEDSYFVTVTDSEGNEVNNGRLPVGTYNCNITIGDDTQSYEFEVREISSEIILGEACLMDKVGVTYYYKWHVDDAEFPYIMVEGYGGQCRMLDAAGDEVRFGGFFTLAEGDYYLSYRPYGPDDISEYGFTLWKLDELEKVELNYETIVMNALFKQNKISQIKDKLRVTITTKSGFECDCSFMDYFFFDDLYPCTYRITDSKGKLRSVYETLERGTYTLTIDFGSEELSDSLEIEVKDVYDYPAMEKGKKYGLTTTAMENCFSLNVAVDTRLVFYTNSYATILVYDIEKDQYYSFANGTIVPFHAGKYILKVDNNREGNEIRFEQMSALTEVKEVSGNATEIEYGTWGYYINTVSGNSWGYKYALTTPTLPNTVINNMSTSYVSSNNVPAKKPGYVTISGNNRPASGTTAGSGSVSSNNYVSGNNVPHYVSSNNVPSDNTSGTVIPGITYVSGNYRKPGKNGTLYSNARVYHDVSGNSWSVSSNNLGKGMNVLKPQIGFEWLFETRDESGEIKNFSFNDALWNLYDFVTRLIFNTDGTPAKTDANGYLAPGNYKVEVGNDEASTVIDMKVTLPENAMYVKQQPVDVKTYVGAEAIFSIDVLGKNLKYQWEYLDTTDTAWQLAADEGAHSPVLKISVGNDRSLDKRIYRCLVFNGTAARIISDEVILFVDPKPLLVTRQPENVSVLVGQTANFAVAADSPDAAYQWQFRNAGSPNWIDLNTEDAKTANLTVAVGTDSTFNGREYRCVMKDTKTFVTATSDAATLTVKELSSPVITEMNSLANGMEVKWDAVEGAAQYRVFYRTGSAAWTTAGNVTENSIVVPGLTVGSTYTFLVRCLSADGKAYTSDYDATKSKSAIYQPILAAPVITNVTNAADGLEVSWGAVEGAAQYRVFFKTGNGAWTTLGSTTGTSKVVNGLVSGGTYSFLVRVLSADGKAYLSEYDATKSKTVTYQPVLASPEITGLTNAANGMEVRWDAVEGAAQYRIFCKAGSGAWTTVGSTSGTSKVVTGLTSGTRYSFLVRCLSADGKAYTSDYDATKSKSITYLSTLPSPDITGFSNTANGLEVKWNAVEGAGSYRVFYRIGSGAWTTAGNVTENSLVVPNLTGGCNYTFLVRCLSADGKAYTSDYEIAKSKTVTYQSTLPSPDIASLTNVGTGVEVKWNAVAGAAQYRVFCKAAGGSWTTVGNVTETSVVVTGLTNGNTYSFLIRCLSPDGKAYTSDYEAAKSKSITYLSTLASPEISELNCTETGVEVKWNAVAGAAQYRVFYRIGSGAWTTAGNVTTNSLVVPGLTAGSTYTFLVRCLSADGKTYTSEYDVTKSKNVIYQPGGNTNLASPVISALNNTSNGVEVKWNAVAGAARYRVFVKSGTGSWTTAGNVTTNSLVVSGLTAGTTYTFLVRCLSADGKAYTSEYDASKSKSITYQPVAGTNLAAPVISGLSNTANGVEVKWNAVSGAAQYRVFFKTGSGAWAGVANTTGTSMVVPNLTKGTTYSFTVRCVSADGRTYTSNYDTVGKSIKFE